jgi:hypothetical protein
MPYNLPQAAAAVGRDRSTILRQIRSGKLAAKRDPVSRSWLIEPSELHRLYELQPDAQQRNAGATAVLEAKLEAEHAKVALLERSVEDLRRRLDAADEERRKLTLVLADMRSATPVPAPARRWWWSWQRR